MDTFAHALWSFLLFHKTDQVWWAVFFGTMPDLSLVPDWVFTLYGITHSVFIMAGVFLLSFLFTGGIPIALWAWPLHVLIDIPTHRRDFLPTPFLWPVSTWKFPGISWGQPAFMIANWSLIIIWFLLFFTGKI